MPTSWCPLTCPAVLREALVLQGELALLAVQTRTGAPCTPDPGSGSRLGSRLSHPRSPGDNALRRAPLFKAELRAGKKQNITLLTKVCMVKAFSS